VLKLGKTHKKAPVKSLVRGVIEEGRLPWILRGGKQGRHKMGACQGEKIFFKTKSWL